MTPLTPARASFRESVKVLTRITKILRLNPHISFEKHVHAAVLSSSLSSSTSLPPPPITSCGETLSCIARIFLRSKDASHYGISRATSPLPLFSILRNRNLIFYLLSTIRLPLLPTLPSPVRTVLTTLARRFSVSGCRSRVTEFGELLSEDLRPNSYPRIFFCNLMWITPVAAAADHGTMGTTADAATDLEKFYDATGEHSFTVVRHGPDSFQMMSGYKAHDRRKPVDLSSWLRSETRFCGFFDAGEMDEMVGMLTKFAGDEEGTESGFDADNYEEMFGSVHGRKGGADVWPSFCYHELDESSIRGYGCRKLVLDVERRIQKEAISITN